MSRKTLRFNISVALFLVATLSITFVTLSSLFSIGELVGNRTKEDMTVNIEVVSTAVLEEFKDIGAAADFITQNPGIAQKFLPMDPQRVDVTLSLAEYAVDLDILALVDVNGNWVETFGLADLPSLALQSWAISDRNHLVQGGFVSLPAGDFAFTTVEKLNQKRLPAGVLMAIKKPIYSTPGGTWEAGQVGWLLAGRLVNSRETAFIQRLSGAIGHAKDFLLTTDNYPIFASHQDEHALFEDFKSQVTDSAHNILAYKSRLKQQGFRVKEFVLGDPNVTETATLHIAVRNTQGVIRKSEQAMMLQLLIVAVFGIVVTGSASFYFTNSVFKPIRGLVETMRQVESGNFSAVYDVKTSDEFGDLARSFNQFTTRIHKSIEKESRYVQELEAINSFGQTITSVLDINVLLDKVVETTLKMMAVRRCSLWLVTADGKSLQNKITRGVAIFDSIEKPIVPIGEGIVGTVAESGKALLINDLKTSEEFANLDNPEYYGVRSVLSVPLIALDKKIGVLNVSKEVVNGFDLDSQNLLSTLAGQAGIAIHNAFLLGQISEKKRIEEELTIYRKIQMRLLPNRVPSVKGLTIHGSMIPAKEVGGDYYDFIFPGKNDDSVGIVIGDVSGKGVSAGLIMMRTRTILHALGACHFRPCDALVKLNELLASTVEVGKFMTLLYLYWDSNTRKMTYAAAGHEHVLLYKTENGKVQSIKSGGIAVGMVDDISTITREKELDVKIGDTIVLYTDGVTEAENTGGQRYNLDRLITAIERHGMKPARELHKILIDDIYGFIGGAEQWDDITLLVLKVGEVTLDEKGADEGELFIDQELDLQFSTLTIE